MEPNKNLHQPLNNAETESNRSQEDIQAEAAQRQAENASRNEKTEKGDDFKYASEDKYLAMEQPGVSFTNDANPMGHNPDNLEYRQHGQDSDKWDNNNRNSQNAEAFNQDEYILRDNVDLDEDQSRSVSADDDFESDINTSDGL